MSVQPTEPSEERPESAANRRGRRPTAACLLVLTTWLLAAGGPARATTYIMPTDRALLERAALVLEGEVLSVEPTPGSALPGSDLLVEIREVLKGFPPGSAVVVRVPGGVRADGMGLRILGMPVFRSGDEVLLFLEPRRDGTFALSQAMLGAFQIVRSGGREVALRDLREARELRPAGKAPAADGPRDLEGFRAWIRDLDRGESRTADYLLPAEAAPPASPKFLLNLTSTEPPPLGCGTNGGHPLRWFDFDEGSEIQWWSHEAGQEGLRRGGEIQVQRALSAWNGDPRTPIRLVWAGTTDAGAGFLARDGQNTLLFNDPNDTITGSFPGEGILALGGPWFLCELEEHGGQSYHRILEADIVTQDGLGAFFPLARAPRRAAEELFAHELGHTLGLGHSEEAEALMNAQIHADLRGAAPDSDDLLGILALYGGTGDGPSEPPPPPAGLESFSESPTQVRLSWSDASETAGSIRIERRIDGVFEVIGSAPGDSLTFVENGLEPSTNYIYRAQAVNAAGRSTYTLPARVRTQVDLKPRAPTNLRLAPLGPDRIRLSWQDNAYDEDETRIEIRTTGPFLEIPISLPPDIREINLAGLEPAITYSLRLRAANAFGTSAYSNTAKVATFAADAACTVDETRLCPLGGRFEVRVLSPGGEAAAAVPASDLGGHFRLPGEEEVALTVRMIDARAQSGYFRFFAATLSELEFSISVRDTASGEEQLYHSPAGDRCGINDSRAFAGAPPAAARLLGPPPRVDRLSFYDAVASSPDEAAPSKRYCQSGPSKLCLSRFRFALEIDWTNQYDGERQGAAQALVGTDETGFFWFFHPDDTLVMARVEDRGEENGHFWLSYGGLTNVEYTLRSRDTVGGGIREYHNPPGTFCGGLDTTAFPAP